MKDYTTGKNEKETFITKVEKKIDEDGKLSFVLHYANGKKLDHIIYNENNIESLKAIQESQAKQAINNIETYQQKKKKFALLTLAGTIIAPTSTFLFNAFTQDNKTIALGVGTVTLLGVIPFLKEFLTNSGKVKELKKIDYLLENKQIFYCMGKYDFAVEGLSKKKKKMILETKEPYSILNIDNYTKEDLENIMVNISKQKTKHIIR